MNSFTLVYILIFTFDLDDVYIVIDTDTLSLNAVTFRAEENLEYNYSIGKEGYLVSEGSMVISKDTTLEIALEKILNASLSKRTCASIGVSIYPNPSANFVKIRTAIAGFNTQVYSIVGQLLINQAEISNQAIVDVNDLRSGIYLIKIQQNGSEITHKLIKK